LDPLFVGLGDRFHSDDFGDSLFQKVFDPLMKRNLGARTSVARPDEPQLNDSVDDIHELHVAAIRLQGGTDLIDGIFDLLS
jgi:hypothetical protein